MHYLLESDQSKWVKPYIEFNTKKKRMKVEKNSDKDGKAFYKLINNAVYGKLRNWVELKLVSNEKYFSNGH